MRTQLDVLFRGATEILVIAKEVLGITSKTSCSNKNIMKIATFLLQQLVRLSNQLRKNLERKGRLISTLIYLINFSISSRT